MSTWTLDNKSKLDAYLIDYLDVRKHGPMDAQDYPHAQRVLAALQYLIRRARRMGLA